MLGDAQKFMEILGDTYRCLEALIDAQECVEMHKYAWRYFEMLGAF